MPPSKTKKSKPSRASDRSPSASSSHSPSTSSSVKSEQDNEARLRSVLSASAKKFPSFISESAFTGKISEVDYSCKFDTAIIWLSESSMISWGMTPASLVSVSLAASDGSNQDALPLEEFSTSEIFSRLDCVTSKINEMGNYFAIATLFPSHKVTKNEVRITPSLSWTMGNPQTGRVIFVHDVGRSSKHFNGNEKTKILNAYNVSFCKCNDIYLKLIPLNTVLMENNGKSCTRDSAESRNLFSPKGSSPYPKTPIQSKNPSDVPEAVSLCESKESTPPSAIDFDISTIRMALNDEKVSKLLNIYAGRWLKGRYLLPGNFVSLPILGKLCVFIVEDISKQTVDSPIKSSVHKKNCNAQVCSHFEPEDIIFTIDTKSKVYLFDTLSPRHNYKVIENTLLGTPAKKELKNSSIRTLPVLGGLSKEVSILKEIIEFSLIPVHSLPRYKGVLLYGPPGTGKTSLASYCAKVAGANFFFVNAPELVSQYYGESEQKLSEVFNSARQAAPSVVFIDELDAVAPARMDGGEELSLRMVATLLTLMDGITENAGMLLIAATNRPDSIDPALRRPGRIDREIEIGVPSPNQRLDILITVLDQMCHSLEDDQIQSLAFATHGFVGADLTSLCNEAAMFALRRYIASKVFSTNQRNMDIHKRCTKDVTQYSNSKDVTEYSDSAKVDILSFNGEVESVSNSLSKMVIAPNSSSLDSKDILISHEFLHDRVHPQDNNILDVSLLKITANDFEKAKLKVRPSAMREVMLELPKVRWEDVGGQMEIKKQLIEAVLWPQRCPDAFKRIGIRPPRGLLMFGPPGCSKTLMARAVSSEAKLNFLAVKGPELFSKWVGESEKAVKSLFAKARANSPAIIFFDEIDGLAITRGHDNDGTSVADRVLSQLLVELDGLDQRSGVTVIAATNRPDKIDPALLRPGRFDRHLDVKPPDVSDREAIFQIHMRDMPCNCDVTAKNLSLLSEGYTGADIKLICREAAIAALEESFETAEISMKHFKVALERVQPSDTEFYLEICKKFKRYVDTVDQRHQ